MMPDDRDKVLLRLKGSWSGTVTDVHLVAWAEVLDPLEGIRAQKAMAKLVTTAKRRPSIAEFLEQYHEERSSRKAIAPPQCGMCENGFVDMHPAQGDGFGWPRTYGRCPNGCMPMSSLERAQYWQDREQTDPFVRRPVADPWKDRMEPDEVF